MLVYNVSCFGEFDGSAKVFVTGTAPITYSWNDPANQSTDSIFGLAASLPLYTVTITDSNNCFVTGVVQISEPNLLSANINAPTTACFGEIVQLYGNGNGGTHQAAPNDLYDIVWTTLGNATGQGPMLDSLTGNITHRIEITDGNGCTAFDTHTIIVSPELLVQASTQTICADEIGSLIAAGSGGNPNNTIDYTWSVIDSTTLTTTYQGVGTPLDVTPTITTNYIVVADDGCSLPAIDVVTLTVNPLPDVQLLSDTFRGCPDLIVDLKAQSNGGGIGTTFQWDINGDGIFDLISANDSINHTYTISGGYDVSVLVTTADLCRDTFTSFNHVTVYQVPVADFSTDPSPAVVTLLNPDIEFYDQTSYNQNAQSSAWYFGDGTSDSVTVDPIHTYQDTGFYDVSLYVTNFQGCSDNITKTIRVKPEFLFIIPNTITPDGDGLNDIFRPGTMIGAVEDDYSFLIFDRWGELLYEGHDLSDGWDGYFKGKLVKTDVYVWKVEIKDLDGVIHNFNGHVNVLK